jgi:hypothetical protein
VGQFVEALVAAGVTRIHGIVGNSLNGLTAAADRNCTSRLTMDYAFSIAMMMSPLLSAIARSRVAGRANPIKSDFMAGRSPCHERIV